MSPASWSAGNPSVIDQIQIVFSLEPETYFCQPNVKAFG